MFVALAALALLGTLPAAQTGTVEAEQKVSETSGGFGGVLDASDGFGVSVAALGDLDDDGIQDLAVAAFRDADGGTEQGAVWILFLNSDGTVDSETKISETTGGFGGVLDPGDNFGYSVAALGDLDGDGIEDLAVGAYGDDDGGSAQGAVWILFLNADGTVASHTKISETSGGFAGALDPSDFFGAGVAALGEFDTFLGTQRLAVGAYGDDDGGVDQGAVWILFLNTDGTVAVETKLSETTGGFENGLDAGDLFGASVAALGDLDANGDEDLAVGAFRDDDGGVDQGAVWILFLHAGTVISKAKISETSGGFGGVLDASDLFGCSVAALGDLDGDGTMDLAVGAEGDDDGGGAQGAVWNLFLNADGTVASAQKISETSGGFGGVLDASDAFGCSVAGLGDLDGDGTRDLAVGARLDDDGDSDQGALSILFLEGPCPAVQGEQKISETTGGFAGVLDGNDAFGVSVAALGDLDGDGTQDLAVGALADDDGGSDQGAVWILFMNTDGTVAAEQKISETTGGFGGILDATDAFGVSVAALGDLDGDGTPDLAVGANGDDDGGSNGGAVWILFLNTDGTVAFEQKISETTGGFGGVLDVDDIFGSSVATLGDLDGDGTPDLAVGARFDDDGGSNHGAVWILFLNSDGTVASEQKISATSGGFGGVLDPFDAFGSSVAALGDLDGDGTPDLAVGAEGDDDGGEGNGAVWILFLNADGTVAAEQKVSENTGGFGGVLNDGDSFGSDIAELADLDGDGTQDLAVGAWGDDDGGFGQGAVWILFLNADGTVASETKISEGTGGFGGVLDRSDAFGVSVAALGDLDGDGTPDLAVGAHEDDDGGFNQGAVWILFLEPPDTTPPALSCPTSISALDSKSGTPGEVAFFSVTASDDEDPDPSVVCVPPSGSFFPRGTTMVNCTATDASGNQTTCMFPVVVRPTVRQGAL